MGDFFQNGPITTLHDLRLRPYDELEADLTSWSAQRPMSLIIPSLYSELEGDALRHIVNELSQVPFLDQIIIGLDRADAVLTYLTSQGVPADSLTATGFGETQPIAPNDTPENKAKNRRIEFRTS